MIGFKNIIQEKKQGKRNKPFCERIGKWRTNKQINKYRKNPVELLKWIENNLPNEKIGFFDNVISFDTADQINLSPIILFSDYDCKSLNIHSSSLNHILMTGWFNTDIFNIKYK